MHGHTPWVSRERPDLARSAPERCWIDGDLIRLSQWPLGGIRPGVRGEPVPWLMDLGVLEEAMQEVYGRGFHLGDRAPLLQLAADALAEGDRSRAAEIADAVAFPAPEFKSRFRDAGLRYLAWGPAHRRGNPRIDVGAWLARTSLERKYDPDQPRVPRGHPDGGQWTDGNGAGSDDESTGGMDGGRADENPGERELTDEEHESLLKIEEVVRAVLGEKGDPQYLATLIARFPFTRKGILQAIKDWSAPVAETLVILLLEGRISQFLFLWQLIESFAPELFEYAMEAEEWEQIAVEEEEYRGFSEAKDFEEHYEAQKKPLRDWRHIVERNAKVAPGTMPKSDSLHSTDNVVQIPRAKHWEITQCYSRPDPRDPRFVDISPRDWLRGKPWQAHYDFGIEMLKKFRGLK